MDVPEIIEIGNPNSSAARNTPMCDQPRAMPPPRARATPPQRVRPLGLIFRGPTCLAQSLTLEISGRCPVAALVEGSAVKAVPPFPAGFGWFVLDFNDPVPAANRHRQVRAAFSPAKSIGSVANEVFLELIEYQAMGIYNHIQVNFVQIKSSGLCHRIFHLFGKEL